MYLKAGDTHAALKFLITEELITDNIGNTNVDIETTNCIFHRVCFARFTETKK
jgi:hypothetical protein